MKEMISFITCFLRNYIIRSPCLNSSHEKILTWHNEFSIRNPALVRITLISIETAIERLGEAESSKLALRFSNYSLPAVISPSCGAKKGAMTYLGKEWHPDP